MRVDAFDYDLPPDRIALAPVEPRDAARLLVVPPAPAPFGDRQVRDLVGLLQPGDALVMNDTRVIPAALDGIRRRQGVDAKVSFNLTRRLDAARWRAFARPGKRLALADRVDFGADLSATVEAKLDAGEVVLRFERSGLDLDCAIEAVGTTPLPPYIALKRPPSASDAQSYQTVYARVPGAVAAPTAGLHMTAALLDALRTRGVTQHTVTLHVGAGTFLPVKADDTRDHVMHSEWCELSAQTVADLERTRAAGGRIIALGTTALRVLETAARRTGALQPWSGETDIFITPGYRFAAVDLLLTNFHLPRSTLMMLVAAFAGLDRIRAAYAHAIEHDYRFYSYGDASLLHRAGPG
jgi:S-adenosylmethionine:tRNA ribosyltransferase-isomerase